MISLICILGELFSTSFSSDGHCQFRIFLASPSDFQLPNIYYYCVLNYLCPCFVTEKKKKKERKKKTCLGTSVVQARKLVKMFSPPVQKCNPVFKLREKILEKQNSTSIIAYSHLMEN